MRHLPSARARTLGTPQTRRRRFRRGTVLLFALGVLAVISIAALSYVTLVRTDRQASSAVAKTIGYERQVSGVTDWIGGLLAADLFGNKLVTTDVPSDQNPGLPTEMPIWPRMFEDGEFRDYPYTNFATFNPTLPGKTPKGAEVSANWVLGLHQVAPPDDAWLAPLDPMWNNPGQWPNDTHWRQITNLRSVYTYDTDGTPNNLSDDRWIRGDGKYVDLGQLFLDYSTVGASAHGNPGTNLLDRSVLGVNSADGPVMPRVAAGNPTNASYKPINMASGDTTNPTLTPRDERFWADTDGDLRADARWQIIDSLGTREGLLWVTAARIVDLSAMVNVNSSIEGGYPSTSSDSYAEGRSPADIDLYRLLVNDSQDESITPGREYDWLSTLHKAPVVTQLSGKLGASPTFSDHLMNRLHLSELFDELTPPPGVTPADLKLQSGWTWDPTSANGRLTWAQRLAYWNHVGSAPDRGPTVNTARGPVPPGYSLTTMIDLHAFSGSNNRSMLTDLEETLDGPDDATGHLPRPEDASTTATGPMRSNTRPGDTRVPPQTADFSQMQPRADEVRADPRRLLTTVSGVSDVSPVPVLNYKAQAWDNTRPYGSQYSNTKIRLSDFSLAGVPDAYQAFVWALEPFATDEYLTAYNEPVKNSHPWGDNASGTTIDLSPSYHYGGADSATGHGIPEEMALAGGSLSVAYGPSSGAAFATITAASLALNLADASDNGSVPSVARVLVSDNNTDLMRSRIVDGKALLGTRFSQGDIPRKLLPTATTGILEASDVKGLDQAVDTGYKAGEDQWFVNNAGVGVTLVGLERHPYIGEVFVVGAFESPTDPSVDLTIPAEQAGALLAVQLINPWPQELKLDGFEIVVVSPALALGSRSLKSNENLRFTVPNGSIIPAASGGSNGQATFLYIYYNPNKGGAPDSYKAVLGRDEDDTEVAPPTNSIEDVIRVQVKELPAKHLVPADQTTRDLIAANPAFVMRMQNSVAGSRTTVVLRQAVGLAEPAVLDVLETDKPFFAYGPSVDLRDATFGFDDNYFRTIGYVTVGTTGQADDNRYILKDFAGRILLTSSVTRPVRNKGAAAGQWFSYAAIQPLANETHVNFMPSFPKYYAHAWLATSPTLGQPGLPASDLIAPGAMVPAGRLVPTANLIDDMDLESMDAKPDAEPAYSDRATGAGGWQLFVPDRPLRYVSELHEICVFANTCKNNALDTLDAWATVGQQLRGSIDWTIDGTSPTSDNPYLGVLDPTRFIPTGDRWNDGPGTTRDDSLALPLALRVFDCFEALDPADVLAEGRININTAPERVLQVLPLMAVPQSNDPGLGQPAQDDYNSRPKMMLQYRDAWNPDFGDVNYDAYSAGTMLQLGLNIYNDPGKGNLVRRHDASHNEFAVGPNVQYPYTTGFATAGELAILDSWGNIGNGLVDSSGNPPTGFVKQLSTNNKDESALQPRVFEGETDTAVVADGIIDDPEERLGLFRAVSNIVSSRSDVYGAWFILRGYDPKQIEAITVDQTNPLTAMDDTAHPFVPAYESRWFVIFDRSNVKKPTDRPKILLKAQLPSSRP